MRLIQTLVPDGKREAVIEILEEADLDFAMTAESAESGFSDILYVPANADEVEPILESLKDVGVERDGYMIVSDVEAIVSEQFEVKHAEGNGEAEDDRISRDELRTKARNLSPSTPNYRALTLISAIVASAGLLEDSAAVVVGSMVIAPLIGPAMASCVGTVINDDELFREGVRSQVVGIGLAVACATAFAFAYRVAVGGDIDLLLIQQVAERAHPGLLSLAIALGAGAAGALALTSGADEALVGVMIAVALIPPAASVGLGIAYLDPTLAVGAGVLVAVNVLSINLAGVLTLWIKEYEPDHWYDAQQARQAMQKRMFVFAVAVLVLTAFLAVSSLGARDNVAFESEVESIVDATVDREATIEFHYDSNPISREPTGVTVAVDDEDPPAAATLRERIRDRTGADVTVRVIAERTDVSAAGS